MQRPCLAHLVWTGLVLSMACAGSPAQQSPGPQARTIKPQEILEVIEALKAHLLRQQKPDGAWPEFGWADGSSQIMTGGHTALACWALLQAGQDPFSEPIHKAATSLLTTNIIGTYSRSLRCMLMAALARIEPGGKYAKTMQSDVDFLLQTRLPNGRWSYFNAAVLRSYTPLRSPDNPPIGDNSNTQFAVLALREAGMGGATIPQNVWRETRDYWQENQNEDGGFGYRRKGFTQQESASYGSMTAAGAASMFIAEDMVRGARCCVGEQPESIARALEWLSANFSPTENPRHGAYYMYWMYSIERVAEASGYRSFGEHDWFREGAAAVLDVYRRKAIGDLSDHAFALIFLAKSVAPMVCSKLEFGDAWNPNPLDATHMTRYLGSDVFERHLNWQIVRLDAPLAAYQEAPVLLVTTKKWPAADDPLTEPLREKIREFCETGGTLLVDHTCSPDPDFHASLAAFLEKTWPGRRFRPVPGSHPIYSAHFPLQPKIALQAMGNGCREYVLVCDSTPGAAAQPAPGAATTPSTAPATGPAERPDLSCTWQKSLVREQLPAFQIAANIFMYATDKSFRNKIQPRSDLPRATGTAAATLLIARLQHANNWNPCPLATPMLSQALSARAGIDLAEQPVTLDAAQLAGRKVLVICGQGKLDWTGEQIAVVRDYIKAGGSVLADSLMGDREFADSLRRLAAAALGSPARPIPENDPLLTGTFDPKAFNLDKVQYSRTLRWRKGTAGPATLEGVQQGNRWAFVISPYDLTNGLTTAKPYGVLGYEPDDATRIAASCMLYFASKAGIAPAAPATPPPAAAVSPVASGE